MSYGDTDGWRNYSEARGLSAPAATPTDEDNEALARAQDYIRHRYVRRFVSQYSADSDYVEESVYEAASIEKDSPHFFSKTAGKDEKVILTEVEGIKWTPLVNKSDGLDVSQLEPVSTKIDSLIGMYLPSDGSGQPLWSVG